MSDFVSIKSVDEVICHTLKVRDERNKIYFIVRDGHWHEYRNFLLSKIHHSHDSQEKAYFSTLISIGDHDLKLQKRMAL